MAAFQQDADEREWMQLLRPSEDGDGNAAGDAALGNLNWGLIPHPCQPNAGTEESQPEEYRGKGYSQVNSIPSAVAPAAHHLTHRRRRSAVWHAALPPLAGGGTQAQRVQTPKKLKQLERRLARKRREVDSFFAVLDPLLRELGERLAGQPQPKPQVPRRRLRVVDFGSGSGALTLPLAAALPHVDFVAVDIKPMACRLLQERAARSGLTNVAASCGLIQDFAPAGPVDVVLGLHACGVATDFIMERALGLGAAYVLSPCCIGKVAQPSGRYFFFVFLLYEY